MGVPAGEMVRKNKLDVAYHTDLELETNHDLLTKYDYVITAGPMRYWTENTEIALKNFVHSGGNLVHLGSEAGQHLVALKNTKDTMMDKSFFNQMKNTQILEKG